MLSASGALLTWRPLPSILRHSSNCHHAAAAATKRGQITAMSTPGPPCSPRNLVLQHNSLRSSSSADYARLRNSSSNLDEWRRSKRRGCGVTVTTAGMRLDPGGGNDGRGGIGRVVANVVLAGALTYLTLTGKLGWVFDTIISLWLLAVLVPIIGVVAFLWFAEREIVRGACPNCGQEFQVFEFALKEQPNLCPYCSQPFKLDSGRQFVRDEPRFSNQKSSGFRDGFGSFGRGASSPKDQDLGGIVDIEAEVVDRE